MKNVESHRRTVFMVFICNTGWPIENYNDSNWILRCILTHKIQFLFKTFYWSPFISPVSLCLMRKAKLKFVNICLPLINAPSSNSVEKLNIPPRAFIIFVPEESKKSNYFLINTLSFALLHRCIPLLIKGNKYCYCQTLQNKIFIFRTL